MVCRWSERTTSTTFAGIRPVCGRIQERRRVVCCIGREALLELVDHDDSTSGVRRTQRLERGRGVASRRRRPRSRGPGHAGPEPPRHARATTSHFPKHPTPRAPRGAPAVRGRRGCRRLVRRTAMRHPPCTPAVQGTGSPSMPSASPASEAASRPVAATTVPVRRDRGRDRVRRSRAGARSLRGRHRVPPPGGPLRRAPSPARSNVVRARGARRPAAVLRRRDLGLARSPLRSRRDPPRPSDAARRAAATRHGPVTSRGRPAAASPATDGAHRRTRRTHGRGRPMPGASGPARCAPGTRRGRVGRRAGRAGTHPAPTPPRRRPASCAVAPRSLAPPSATFEAATRSTARRPVHRRV